MPLQSRSWLLMVQPIPLPADTPLWLQIVIAGIVLVSVYFAIRAYWRSGKF